MRLLRSHRLEHLLDALVSALDARRDVLEPAEIVTRGRALDRAIELHVARARGIAANLRFTRLDQLVADWLERRTGKRPADQPRFEAALLSVLFDERALRADALSPVRHWLSAAPPEAQPTWRASLARRMAELLVAYDRTRADLVLSWARGDATPRDIAEGSASAVAHEGWQRALLLAARDVAELRFASELILEVPPQIREGGPLHVFLPSAPPETLLRCLAKLAEERDVTVYAIDPCREFWEDALSDKERARRERSGAAPSPSDEQENPLLSSWGRPGRQVLGALYQLADWSTEDLYDETEPRVALDEVQLAIVERRPCRPRPVDGSLTKIMAPSLRRELEIVASEIWERVSRGAKFTDIAVLVPDAERDRYLPLLRAIFAEARQLPMSSSDGTLLSTSPLLRAASMLVSLLVTTPTRSRLLDLLLLPALRARMPEARPTAWAAMLDRLGFFAGLAEADARGGDLSQALVRMAAGAVAPGERSGERSPLGPIFVEEIDATSDESGGLYVMLRSLQADLMFARASELPLTEWARFFAALFQAYLYPEDAAGEADLRRAQASVTALERRHVEGGRYPVLVAARLVLEELASLRAEVGSPGVWGVTVATLSAHRGLPTAHVFVVGLGEGRFGAGRAEQGLDISRGVRRPLDADEAEVDRYAFLETVTAARESLTVSWVARDESTGDALEPAVVLTELFEVAGSSFEAKAAPLRRDEDDGRGPYASAALPVAVDERAARALGDRERAELESDATQPSLAISAFARLVHEDDPRRALLGWDAVAPRLRAPLPGPTSASTGAPRRLGAPKPQPPAPVGAPSPTRPVRLAELRAFLERPMQASAEHALGHVARTVRERLDEPPTHIEHDVARRLITDLAQAALEGPPARAKRLATLRLAREQAKGRSPSGALGEHAAEHVRQTVSLLVAQLTQALEPDVRGTVRPFRLGPGRTVSELPELSLPALNVGSATEGRSLVQGEGYAWIAAGGRALVAIEPFGPPPSNDKRARLFVLRALMRAFVDHAALACVSPQALGGAGLGRAVVVVTPAGTHRSSFRPMDPDVASAWLNLLARELDRGHAAFLPGELVLGEAARIVRGDADVVEALERAIERGRAKDDRLSELFGPVRDAKHRPSPERPELLRIVGQRFGPFFSLSTELRALGDRA